ncbi:hypothetical protein IFO70_28575 [Phormidium tenue FACHB-886]|nr:hypothetical protein [Phormidium tenue FACHB-886]
MTFRFPPELVEEIISRANASGKDRTAIVVEALFQAFGLPSLQPSITTETLSKQLNQLEDAVTQLSEQVDELRQTVDAGGLLAQRLNTLEQAVALVKPLCTTRNGFDGSVLIDRSDS